jgi:hypothetical protein
MPISFSQKVSLRWYKFKYNFGWSNYAWLFENWIARSTFLVPFLGYLVLFNDEIANLVKFETIANETALNFGLSSKDRLRLIYLGLLLLSVAQASYLFFRPSLLRFSSDIRGFVDYGLTYFTFGDFLALHDTIGYSGSGPVSGYGDYSTSEWEAFVALATGETVQFNQQERRGRLIEGADWTKAKSKYEDLLKSILKETFAVRNRKKRTLLAFTLFLGFLGYLFLLLPSIDLTVKVLTSIWLDWF